MRLKEIMAELPTGTVTFLFTDIEGSTRLLQALGEGYRVAQDRHTEIVRAAIREHQGHEIRTEGDSFFVVFRTPGEAVQAAVAAQRGLARHDWPHGSELRVRMGLHTGEGVAGGDDYLGIDVNRAARIAASGHGGQILLSDATRALVAASLPEGVRVRTLGSYRLRDLPGPERLHQLEIRSLPSAFPPLRALDVRRAHLPPEATRFIGRGGEIHALTNLLTERRLITLTGPGGTGKTRLALRTAADVADRFPDGAYFVGVAGITDPALLTSAIASELNLPDDGSRQIGDVVHDWFSDRQAMLVLDNLEQIEGAGRVIDGLLTSAPRLQVLATSRSPLHVAGEQEFPVPPFPVPTQEADPPEVRASEAVQLFADRVRLVRPGFEPTPNDVAAIADICRRLDGLPLPIELAAARVRLLSLTAIRDRLGRRLDAVVGGPSTVPGRHRSLREAIGWSHDLLDEPGKALFRRLAVFVGGWTIDAAEEVCAGSPVTEVEAGLETLAQHSLIQASPVGDEPRFTVLETIGEFAREQLEASGEALETRERHVHFFHGLAEEALRHSEGPARDKWFDRLEAELDNMRAAIDRAAEGGDPEHALGIAAFLRPFWLQRNHGGEGLRVLVTLAEQDEVPEGPEFAAATAAAAAIATWLGDYATGRRMGELSVGAFRRLGNRRGFADAVGTLAFTTIEIDAGAALALNKESLVAYQDSGDIRGQGQALLGRATAQFALGRLSETRESLERSLELLRQAGDHYFELFCTIFLGRIKLLMGDVAAGMRDYRWVLETSRKLDLRLGIAIGLEYIGEVAIWAGDVPRAVRLGATAERLKEELGGGIPPRMGGALEPVVAGRDELSPAEFEREMGVGRAMDVDSAIMEALATSPPDSVPSSAGSLPPTSS
jgi:predicted ATPase/class 3 adenylate cyclase